MLLNGFMCIFCFHYHPSYYVALCQSVMCDIRACSFIVYSSSQAVCLFIFSNAFRLSRRISLKWIQGHLKGRGGKNWGYIFNANPTDGALISPDRDHLVARWLHVLQRPIFRFNNHDDKSLLLQSLTSDSKG